MDKFIELFDVEYQIKVLVNVDFITSMTEYWSYIDWEKKDTKEARTTITVAERVVTVKGTLENTRKLLGI